MNRKFEESLISGVAFVAVYIGLTGAGFVLTGAVFGLFGGIMLCLSIYHTCKEIWRD
jgi:hypothetical protein